MKQYITRFDGKTVSFITTRKHYTHAVVGVFADTGKPCALGTYESQFSAYRALPNWRGFPAYSKVVVVPVESYPLAEGALT